MGRACSAQRGVAKLPFPFAVLAMSMLASVLLGATHGAEAATTATIDTCPTASWKSLPMFMSAKPLSSADAIKLLGDPSGKGTAYAQERALPVLGANAAFIVLALVFLLTLALWRPLRGCCMVVLCKSSCDDRRAKHNPDKVLFNKGTVVLKSVMFVFGLAAVALAIYGMATLNPTLSNDAWSAIGSVSTFLRAVVTRITGVKTSVEGVQTTLTDLKAAVNAGGRGGAQKTAIATACDNAVSGLNSVVSGIASASSGIENGALKTVEDFKASAKPTTDEYDGYRYKATIGLYALVILCMLLLAAAAYFNCQVGLAAVFGATLLFVLFYFIVAFLFGAILMVEFDACPNLEPVIVDKLGSTVALNYYLYNQGATSAADVLKQMGIADVAKIKADAVSSIDTAITQLNAAFAGSATASEQAALDKLPTNRDAISAAVDALIAAGDYSQVNPIYRSVKGFICCDFPAVLGNMWTALTFSGLTAWISILCGFFLLGRIDALPRVDACGCSCHTFARWHDGVDQRAWKLKLQAMKDRVGSSLRGVGGGKKNGGSSMMADPYAAPTAPPMNGAMRV